jgi:putative transposase
MDRMTAAEFTRKEHRLNREEYFGQRWFFITMCCEHREPVFLKQDRADWIVAVLKAEAVAHQFLVDAYCVMPDHLHFLVLGTTPTSNLFTFVKSFKQKTAYVYQKEHGTRLWQKSYYDHVLRSNEKSSHVAAYIWMNPVRKGLCKNFDEYPFLGSFTRPWKSCPAVEIWVPPWKEPKMPA